MFRYSQTSAKPAQYPHQWIRTLDDINRLKRMMLGLPINLMTGTAPFGYEISKEDPKLCIPIPHLFEALVVARDICEDQSEMAGWEYLMETTGKTLSRVSFKKIMRCHPPVDECLLDYEDRLKLLHDA